MEVEDMILDLMFWREYRTGEEKGREEKKRKKTPLFPFLLFNKNSISHARKELRHFKWPCYLPVNNDGLLLIALNIYSYI